MPLADRRAHAARYYPARCPRAPMWNARCPEDRPRARRQPPAAMRFPPPWFFPLHPLFRGAPFYAEHGRGKNPSRGKPHGCFHVHITPPYGWPPPPPRNQHPQPPQSCGGRVGPEPAAAVQVLARFRPFVDHAKRVAMFTTQDVARRVVVAFATTPVTRRARTTRQSPCQPANGRGLSCRLRFAQRRCGHFSFLPPERKWGGKNKKWEEGGQRNGG